MLSANYTSEDICRALGLGGFANDLELAQADECIRVLLAPSFHPEVCVSILKKREKVSVSVVTAVSQIWLQDWPMPQLTKVEANVGVLSGPQFATLSSLLHAAAETVQATRFVILDGMRAHTVLRADREGKINLHNNVAKNEIYTLFMAEAIRLSHSVIGSPSVRNALVNAGTYVGLRIPFEDVLPAKDVVHTPMLGSPEETGQLLAALRTQAER